MPCTAALEPLADRTVVTPTVPQSILRLVESGSESHLPPGHAHRRNLLRRFRSFAIDFGGFFVAWLGLLATDLVLRVLPSRWLTRDLPPNTDRVPDAVARYRIVVMSRAVHRAARRHLYPMTCLRRALVLRRLLKLAGVNTRLHYGVLPDENGIRAHAWLEHRGRPIAESKDPAHEYSRLRRISD